NDDTVAGGSGFGMHPHDNMEIITIVLKGELEHKDSMGHTERIRENEVQVMSAGTGLYHSEYNPDPEKPVQLFQIWIFPNKRNLKPRYDQKTFDKEDRINERQTLVSPMDMNEDGLKINQEAWIYRTALEKDKSLQHDLHNEHNGMYLLVVEGSVTINGRQLS